MSVNYLSLQGTMHGRVKVGGKARDASDKAATPRKKKYGNSPCKKKEVRNIEEIETELMHVEEDIYTLECKMEQVVDVEMLEQLYEENERKSCYERSYIMS